MTRKTVEYFPHDCNAADDPKNMIMIAQMGLEAYGIYWVLVEYLRQQPGYRAPITLLDALSRRHNSSKEKFETVIARFGLFEFDDKYFFSPSLTRRMEPLDSKREYMRDLALKKWEDRRALRTHSDGTAQAMQSRVEKSRVEKSRVEKSRVKKSRVEQSRVDIALADFSFVDNLFLPAWEKWIAYKEELKDPYKTVSGMKSQYAHFLKISNSDPQIAMLIVEKCIRKEWKGLFPLDEKEITELNPEENGLDRLRKDVNNAMKK